MLLIIPVAFLVQFIPQSIVFPLLELLLLLRERNRIQQMLCFCLKGLYIRQKLGKQRNGFFSLLFRVQNVDII